MVVSKETFNELHLYVAFGSLDKLRLEFVNIVNLFNGFHLLIAVIIDKPDAFVIGIIKVQAANRAAIVIIGKNGKIGL